MMKILLLTTIFIGIGISISWAEGEHDHDHDHDHSKHEKPHKEEIHEHKKKESQHKKQKRKHEDHDKHEDDHEHEHKDSHEKHGEAEDGHAHDHDDSEDGHAHEHGEESFGEGKAITEVFSEGEKFKLSESSQKLLEIKISSSNQKASNQHIIPRSSLVRFQANQGVFVLRDGWFQLIELDSEAKEISEGWLIVSNKLRSQENIVVSGVPLLRVAHLQASGQGGKGHAH